MLVKTFQQRVDTSSGRWPALARAMFAVSRMLRFEFDHVRPLPFPVFEAWKFAKAVFDSQLLPNRFLTATRKKQVTKASRWLWFGLMETRT